MSQQNSIKVFEKTDKLFFLSVHGSPQVQELERGILKRKNMVERFPISVIKVYYRAIVFLTEGYTCRYR